MFKLLTLILDEQQGQRCIHTAREKDIRGGLVLLGKGTINNTMLNLLGIKSQKKEIITYLIEEEKANDIMDYFTDKLQLCEVGHGIAYMTNVIIANNIIVDQQVIKKTVQGMKGKTMFNKLTVIVDRGMAEEVMDIARKAGARGGTILHGRGTGAEFTTKLLGMEIEPEKELVMILMPSELIGSAVEELFNKLQLEIPGKGILFVEPVIEVRGLLESC
jgi:nitrogen regulatory protein PII